MILRAWFREPIASHTTRKILEPVLERTIERARSERPQPRESLAQKFVIALECFEPGPPAPLMLQMREPRRRHDERRTITAHRIGKAHAALRRLSVAFGHSGRGSTCGRLVPVVKDPKATCQRAS